MIVVAGHLRLKPDTLERLRPHMATMIAASRAEAGCLAYSYASDLTEPALVRVFELWRSRGDVDRHFATSHLRAWRARLAEIGIEERRLTAYEASEPRPV